MRLMILVTALTAGSLAASPVLTFNTATASSGSENNQSVGWEFNVLTPITVNGLGWYDQNGDGLQLAHTVGIWNSSGTLLSSAVVAQGTADPLDGLFRTILITPVILMPGTNYIVGGQNFSTNSEQLAFGVSPTTISSIAFVRGEFSNANGIFEEPTNPTGVSNCCWGPSFSVSNVPEPSVVTLCGFGLITMGLAVYLRRTLMSPHR